MVNGKVNMAEKQNAPIILTRALVLIMADISLN